jgi:hypothetical protein
VSGESRALAQDSRRVRHARMTAFMQGDPMFDHAIVDGLQQILEGAADVFIVGALADTARERLARSLTGTLSITDTPGSPHTRHDTVVVLDINRLGEGQAVVRPGGTLAVAAANPRYAAVLLEVLEGSRGPWTESAGLDWICRRLEADGWEVEDTRPVIVPLALLPFDPRRFPKTVLAYLYAREPEIETYCFLVRARQPVARPPLTKVSAREAQAEFPTTPWKSEAEWREESRRELEALQFTLRLRDDELASIKASPAWRAVVKYRTMRERVLPPATGRGRLYDRVRLAVHRIVDHGR